MIELSIIIVSYNARVDLERCLRSLTQHPPKATHDVVVVDNASADGSAEAAGRFPGVRVIQAGRNAGFAAGNNIGIRASSGEYVLLLNSDTIVPPGAIDTLLERLRRAPEAAIAGPRLVDGQGRPELSFGSMITPLNEWRQRRLVRGLAGDDPVVAARVDAMTRREQYPDWVSGACLLVRRQDAEAVGLLDERFFMYTEDVDFCAAVRARGRRVLFTPSAEIIHLRGRSAASAPAATRAGYERSHLAFYWKHHRWLAPFLAAFRWLRRPRS
jgi:GT2 family glycosyltransferase